MALCAPNSGNRREKYAPTSFKRVMRKMTHVCGMTKREIDVREHFMLLEKIADAELFEQDESKQHHAPEDKIPARPVPEASEKPHDREREHRAGIGRAAVAAAAERDVHIVAKPCAERDVPAAVELAHRARGVGQVKVARHRVQPASARGPSP